MTLYAGSPRCKKINDLIYNKIIVKNKINYSGDQMTFVYKTLSVRIVATKNGLPTKFVNDSFKF